MGGWRGLGVAMDKTYAKVVMEVRKVSLVGVKVPKLRLEL
jgi:hypothetical protein